MRFDCLDDWLHWQESLNPAEIELGLERVCRVLKRVGYRTSFNCPLITVAGTNGKGSVVAMLEAIAMAAGLKVCSYTSPHLFRYNERIRINGQAVADESLCAAFERIDQARENSALTYFEFGTLAAIDVFFRADCDLVILEVGLGGRLDAVNVMDADVSVLTSVAIDHTDWLGDNRESIGYEKAGIFRAGRTVICGEPDVPESVLSQAQKLQCEFILIADDYRLVQQGDTADTTAVSNMRHGMWTLNNAYGKLENLPLPSLAGEFQKSNAATAITALQALQAKALLPALEHKLSLPQAVSLALKTIVLPGRFQLLQTKPRVYVDVAHNVQAAQSLAALLKSSQPATDGAAEKGKTRAIVAMLSDKDITGVLNSVSAEIDHWCFAGLENTSRGASLLQILEKIPQTILPAAAVMTNAQAAARLRDELAVNPCTIFSDSVMLAKTVSDACRLVLASAGEHDRIIIFGSFHTVAEAMNFFNRLNEKTVESMN